MKGILDNLEARGANREASKAALLRMVKRFRDDADRNRREAEREVAYQARLAVKRIC